MRSVPLQIPFANGGQGRPFSPQQNAPGFSCEKPGVFLLCGAAAVNAAEGMTYADAAVKAEVLGEILKRLTDGTVNAKGAKRLFSLIWEGAEDTVDALIEKEGLKQISDASAIEGIIDEVLANNAKMVEEFRAGKQKAFNALVGQAMKATRGKANPQQVNEILRAKLAA